MLAVGRYVVGTPVGRGAMGEVFRGYDNELARPVALKRLHAAQSSDTRERLVREARAAAQLQHPNVVAVYEIVDDAAGAVLATEWIDGVTLREWLRGQPRPWREIVEVVAGAGRGLAAAHAAGIVHRDFKPENVLVDRRNRARVADFGLASALDLVEGARIRPDASLRGVHLTATGAFAGTPAYMAPELIDGARPDARSDQFAFAVTLFEAVTGADPFAGKTAEAIWAQMAAGQIAKHGARIPAWLDRVLRKALSPDPADRFGSMDELLDLVARRSRRGGIPLVAAGALGGIAVAGIALIFAPSSKQQPSCGEALVEGVWSPAMRDGIAKQFSVAAPARAAAAFAFVGDRVEQWAGAWRLDRHAACTAEPALRRARTACLDRQLGDLRAQLAVLAKADAEVVDHAALAIANLPSPAECIVAPAVSATPAPAAFENAIAELDALRRAGKFVDGRAKIGPLIDAAAGAHDQLAKARAFFAFASIEYELRDHVLAHLHLTEAARSARRAGDEQLLAEILVLDGAVRIVARHPAEALGVLDTVQALSPRPPTGARVQAVRGEALSYLERYDESIAAYREGIAILETEVARDPSQRLRLAAMIGALGSTIARAGRYDEGIAEMKRGLAIEEPVLGPDHPEVARSLHDLATAQRNRGDSADAATNFQRARTIFAAAMGERALEVATCDESLADIALDAGDSKRAYELATRARDIYVEVDADPALISSIETTLGNIQEDTDHCALALPHYERSLAAAKRANQTGTALAISYTNVATCLAETGRDAEARNAVDAALNAFDADPNPDPGKAHAMTVFADLEARAARYGHAIEIGEQVLAILKDLHGGSWDVLRDHVTEGIAHWRRGRT
jgi:tetratricopeptide (TPR) repeat protein